MMGQDGFEYCHYVFSTRNRLPVFGNLELEARLRELIVEICQEKGFDIDVFEIMEEHVHLLIRRKLSDQHRYIMKSIKGISSKRILEFEPSLKLDIGANHLWARGYWVEGVPPEKLEAVRH
jgi:putative transposase